MGVREAARATKTVRAHAKQHQLFRRRSSVSHLVFYTPTKLMIAVDEVHIEGISELLAPCSG